MPACIVCGAYAGEESWRKWCRRCYAKKKRQEELETMCDPSPSSDLKRANEMARQWEDLYNQCLAYWKGKFESSYVIDDALVKRLLMLCHPDKHGGSELSTKVTQHLLGMRNGNRNTDNS